MVFLTLHISWLSNRFNSRLYVTLLDVLEGLILLQLTRDYSYLECSVWRLCNIMHGKQRACDKRVKCAGGSWSMVRLDDGINDNFSRPTIDQFVRLLICLKQSKSRG